MKKIVIAAALLALTAGFSAPTLAAAPCEVVLCMYGKATGNSGGKECKSAEKKFFSIIKKKHGSFNPKKTFNARESFLGSCPGADPASISLIMSKFGKVKLGF